MSKRAITEIIIGVLAVVSVILIAVEALDYVEERANLSVYLADLAICIIFAVEFLFRLRSSESKMKFLRNNGFEILAMIPAIALYELETIPAIPLVFRSLRLVRVVRVVLMLARARRVFNRIGRFVYRSQLLALFSITVAIIFLGAFVVLVLDSGMESAQITSFSDAVWWSISTITTVGYGDIVPSSPAGRIMGMILMIVGIGVMAAFISQVSTTLVESRINRNMETSNLKSVLIAEIKDKLDNIDELSDGEMSLLLQTIQALRTKAEESTES